MDCANPILDGLVRVGTVTDRNATTHKVRVYFPDLDLTSDWLFCLQRPTGITISSADNHTHTIEDGSTGAAGSHSHTASDSAWTPAINDQVLVLFLPVQDGDGVVLGGIS